MSEVNNHKSSKKTKSSKKSDKTEPDFESHAEPISAEGMTEENITEHEAAAAEEPIDHEATATEEETEPTKIKIEFPYSDLLRAQAPKVFETVEEVATNVTHQWKNDEKFENIGMPHPLAEIAAQQILEKAKKVEKKLEEKGVFSLAKMGLAIAKAQADQLKEKLKK